MKPTVTTAIKRFVFSGGELQAEAAFETPHIIKLLHRIQSSDDFMALLMGSEIIRRLNPSSRKLVLPYFPYARQDRITQPNVAFSLKVAANLINALGYEEVITCDVHSDVTPALVDNMRVISQRDIITNLFPGLNDFIRSDITAIIAPDAGAAKKAYSVAAAYRLPLFQAMKNRDTTTGDITSTSFHDEVAGQKCLIVDDICDGGRTFVELARVLREKGASAVYLYVTHGIFSKGYEVFNGLIDGLYSTDSFLPSSFPLPGQVPLYIRRLNYMEI